MVTCWSCGVLVEELYMIGRGNKIVRVAWHENMATVHGSCLCADCTEIIAGG